MHAVSLLLPALLCSSKANQRPPLPNPILLISLPISLCPRGFLELNISAILTSFTDILNYIEYVAWLSSAISGVHKVQIPICLVEYTICFAVPLSAAHFDRKKSLLRCRARNHQMQTVMDRRGSCCVGQMLERWKGKENDHLRKGQLCPNWPNSYICLVSNEKMSLIPVEVQDLLLSEG